MELSTVNVRIVMALSKSVEENLKEAEGYLRNALRDAINTNPASVHPEKQERFTELFVRSLEGKGNTEPSKCHSSVTTTLRNPPAS